MHKCDPPSKRRGFTLIELLVVVVLIAVVLAITAPSFGNLIVDQRLKSVNAQLVTDLQFARSEAAARNKNVFFNYRFSSGAGRACYTIYVSQSSADVLCNCIVGSCTGVDQLRTVELRFADKIRLYLPAGETGDFAFDSVSGGLAYGTSDFVDATPRAHMVDVGVVGEPTGRLLRTNISPAGRPTVCSAGTKPVTGFSSC